MLFRSVAHLRKISEWKLHLNAFITLINSKKPPYQQDSPHQALVRVPSVSQGLKWEADHFATVPVWGNKHLCAEDEIHFLQSYDFKDQCMHP